MTTDNSTGLQRLKRWAANLRAENNSLGHTLETYAMEWERDLARAALAAAPHTATPAQNRGPLSTLTTAEVDFILHDPHGLMLLMDHEDVSYTRESSMCEPDEIGSWPTPRWQAMYERGRSIIAEDLEIWPAEILKQFGFPATPVVQPVVPARWHFEGVPPVGSTCLVWARSSFAKGPYYTVDNYGEQHEAPVSWSSATIPVGDGWDSFDHDDVLAWTVLEQSGPAAPASDADSMTAQPTTVEEVPEELQESVAERCAGILAGTRSKVTAILYAKHATGLPAKEAKRLVDQIEQAAQPTKEN